MKDLGRLGLVIILTGVMASQKVQAIPTLLINFNSFTGIYHLSRDSKGLSLLTSEETILADFPGGGNFTGIKREIPKKYQKNFR